MSESSEATALGSPAANTAATAHPPGSEKKAATEVDVGALCAAIGAVHDLKTPITLALASLERLVAADAGVALSDDVRAQLLQLEAIHLHLRAVTETLLDAASPQASPDSLVVEPSDLRRRLRAVVDLFRPFAARHQLAIELELPEEPVWGYVHPIKFEKICANLLSNALKFSPVGGRVAVSLHTEKRHSVLRVRDSGPGIPAAERPGLFKPFRRSTERGASGTGLGLFLVKRFVEEHQGTVEVVSAPDEAACFEVRLHAGSEHLAARQVNDPDMSRKLDLHARRHYAYACGAIASAVDASPDASGDGSSQALPPRVQRTKSGTSSTVSRRLETFRGGERVAVPPSIDVDRSSPSAFLGSALGARTFATSDYLRAHAAVLSDEKALLADAEVIVVEDHPAMRQYYTALLGEHFCVRSAAHGEQALALAREKPPDLVVSDVIMPTMGGLKLCERLRLEPEPIASVPIMLVSARESQKDLQEGLAAGANDYLKKPFHPQELAIRADMLIRNARQRRALALAHQTLSARQSEIDSDLSLARRFQRRAQSWAAEPNSAFDVAVLSEPAMAVGGDICALYALSSRELRCFIGDITDHGIQAALRVGFVQTLFDRVKRDRLTPGEVLSWLNTELTASGGLDIQLEAACIDLSLTEEGLQLSYAQAGGDLALRWLASGPDQARVHVPPTAQGAPLGIAPGLVYATGTQMLPAKGRLFAATDGLGEQRNLSGHLFETGSLDLALARAASAAESSSAIASVIDDFRRFCGPRSQGDDVTVVAVSW